MTRLRDRLLVVALGLAVLTLLAGCLMMMNLHELRQQPPSRSAVIAGARYDVLAGCSAEGFQLAKRRTGWSNLSRYFLTVTPRPDQQRTTITANTPGQPSVALDVIFVQQDSDVLVESRMGDWLGGQCGLLPHGH